VASEVAVSSGEVVSSGVTSEVAVSSGEVVSSGVTSEVAVSSGLIGVELTIGVAVVPAPGS
jgi:hypothetical protein